MNAAKFKRQPRKAVSVVSVHTIGAYDRNKNFHLSLNNGQKVTNTGFLEIATLKSKEQEFRLRWDEKDSMIDVDMRTRCSEKWLKNGFREHHAKQLSKPPNRKYFVNIIFGNNQIFKGIIELIVLTENLIEKSLRYEIKR